MKLKLRTDEVEDIHLDFNGGGRQQITIHCGDALDDQRRISLAVNLFEALVAVLAPFRSDELGGHLIDMIDMREKHGEVIQKKLTHIVNTIDVILDLAERDNNNANADNNQG